MKIYSLLFLATFSSWAFAEPKVVYDQSLSKTLKVQPCTQADLPLINEAEVIKAIQCDYPKMEIIKFKRSPNDRDTAEVKLYKKGQLKVIKIHFSTGLTIVAQEEQ
ncbi:hypothetical protein [Marinicellulosiphila megalodicopiae]|uniref:hypothetical protein n=1 Tax=Marinicellulosiphila megalodicopiae TaxID=2724896 RepID=UPI003BAF828B